MFFIIIILYILKETELVFASWYIQFYGRALPLFLYHTQFDYTLKGNNLSISYSILQCNLLPFRSMNNWFLCVWNIQKWLSTSNHPDKRYKITTVIIHGERNIYRLPGKRIFQSTFLYFPPSIHTKKSFFLLFFLLIFYFPFIWSGKYSVWVWN